MRPSANWQILLVSQITRGTFFMHPQIALGMAPKLESLIGIKSAKGFQGQLDPDFERPDFSVLAQSGDDETYSAYDSAPEGSTAIFPLRGTMLKYGTWCEYGTTEIASYMREAIYHKNISSIVLDIDSGGGSVGAVAPISQVIAEARAQGKPVVAKVDLCCSAAYWAATECDWIVADNNVSAEIGSIGVMISFIDMVPYYEKMGAKFHKIYATQSEHKNQAFELALEEKYELIKAEILDPLAIGFQNQVKARRKDKLNMEVEGLLTGKTFFSSDAKDHGLIDEVGDQYTAINRARQLSESRKFLTQL